MTSIALVGDSHSVTSFKTLRPFLESKGYEVLYDNRKSGWSARAFITRSDVNIHDMPKGISKAVISLGGNNAELDEETYFARLDTFIDRLKESGIKDIVWLGPMYTDESIDPNTAARHDWTRDAQKKYFAKTPYEWIDMYPYSQEGHYSDGIHFNANQYKYMINSIEKDILNGLRVPSWLRKPQEMWKPLVVLTCVGLLGYIVYELYEEDQWDIPRIS